MAIHRQTFCRQDDDPHLMDDDLAGKVLRYIRYVTLVDTSRLSVLVLGRTVILSGCVSCEAELGYIEEAAASVIGVHLVDNQAEVLKH